MLLYNIKNNLISKRDESEVAGFMSSLVERAETRRYQVKGKTAEVTGDICTFVTGTGQKMFGTVIRKTPFPGGALAHLGDRGEYFFNWLIGN